MRDCNLNGVDDMMDLADGTTIDTDSDGIPDDCELRRESCVQPLQYWKTHGPKWPYGADLPSICGMYWYRVLEFVDPESGWFTLAYHWVTANINLKLEIEKHPNNTIVLEDYFGTAYECFEQSNEILNSYCFDRLSTNTPYPEARTEAFGCGLVLAEFNEGMHAQPICLHHKTKYRDGDDYGKAESIYRIMKEENIVSRSESVLAQRDGSVTSRVSGKELILVIFIGIIVVAFVVIFVAKVAVPKWRKRRETYSAVTEIQMKDVEFD